MNKQANSRYCFVCGVENPSGLHLKFYEVEPGQIIAETVVPDQFQGYPGVCHGGVVAAMLDEVSGRTLLRGDPPRWMVTAKLEIRYRKPVPIRKRLYLEGKAKEDNGRVATVVGAIYDDAHQLLAEAEATLVNAPAHVFDGAAFGPDDWRVYPDED